jgi:hypothetical protein
MDRREQLLEVLTFLLCVALCATIGLFLLSFLDIDEQQEPQTPKGWVRLDEPINY